MSRKYVLLIFIVCLYTTACIQVKSKKDAEKDQPKSFQEVSQPPVENKEVESLQDEDELSVELQEDSLLQSPMSGTSMSSEVIANRNPNTYVLSLKFNFNENSTSGREFFLRKTTNNIETLLPLTLDKNNIYEDKQVVSGSKYEYQLIERFNNSYHLIHGLQVDIPQDFVLPDGQQLNIQSQNIANTFKKYKRIFLGKNSKLITNGYNLNLDVTMIFSQDSTIETFVENTRAPLEEPGRHGGILNIAAEKVEGQLFINLRGEHGGHGRNGIAGKRNPNQGTEGRQSSSYINRCSKIQRDIDMTCGEHICRNDGVHGGKGPVGFPGENGGNGQTGGDSGELHLVLKKQKDTSNIKVNQNPGEGGLAGYGGAGGLGGQGGGVTGEYRSVCPQMNPGAQGEMGMPGANGRSGVSGKINRFCIEFSDKEIWCSKN